MQKWKRLDSETVYDSPHMRVKRDLVELPDGTTKDWTYWDSRDSAMVLGLTADKRLVMIRQYRYMADEVVIEFPSGYCEAGETAQACARREFEEETGYRITGGLKELGAFYETYGQLNRRIHIFFADSITEAIPDPDRDGRGHEEIEVALVTLDEAAGMALDNRILAMGSALAILLLRERLG